jgi:hypothetical protein
MSNIFGECVAQVHTFMVRQTICVLLTTPTITNVDPTCISN